MTEHRPTAWTGAEILDATGGELLSGSGGQQFAGIGIDSRSIAADQLFVAIAGEVHDGHRFCEEVIEAGIRGLIVARQKAGRLPVSDWRKQRVLCVVVPDTTRALGDLAAYNRKRSGTRVIAITGSNGKTTTRKFTAAVAGQRYRTLATRGNLNNAIGLPLTMLRLRAEHEWAVLELGTNHPGEIAYLAAICRPEIGVITNIAPAHLEGLGTLEGVARAKGELLQGLTEGGKAVLNADDPHLLRLAEKCPRPVVLFGAGSNAEVRATRIRESGAGVGFELAVADRSIDIDLQIPGRFMVPNALAASAVGHLLGLSLEAVKNGLEQVRAESGRMAVLKTGRDITIVDDAYNANPASMRAAFAALNALRGKKRSVIVLGDMLELGESAADWHRRVAADAAKSGSSLMYFTGSFAEQAAESARKEKTAEGDVFVGTREDIVADLKRRLRPGDWVLIKGSRGMRMEKIVDELKQWANGDNASSD